MRTLTVFLLAAALLFPAACGPRDDGYNPSHFRLSGVLAPPEVVLPRNAPPGSAPGGLYLKTAGTAGACCWISTHARVLVRKAASLRTLRMSVYIPSVSLFESQPQRFTIRCGAAHMTSSPLGPGFHTIRLRLPAGTRADASTVPVTIEARVGYAPIPSVRYAAILLSIYFE